MFYRKLAADLAAKRKLQYSEVLGWLRCRISFVLLWLAIMAIRGSRSSSHSGAPADINVRGYQEYWPVCLSDNNLYIITHYSLHYCTIPLLHTRQCACVPMLYIVCFISSYVSVKKKPQPSDVCSAYALQISEGQGFRVVYTRNTPSNHDS